MKYNKFLIKKRYIPGIEQDSLKHNINRNEYFLIDTNNSC